MHSVHVYIHESLDTHHMVKMKDLLARIPYVVDVGLSDKDPHGFYVDYEEDHDIPMEILRALEREGLHPDIVSA